jgi:glucuronosyltransferase
MRYSGDYENLFLYWRVGELTTTHALENIDIQKFIVRKDLHFDLIISEQFFQEAFLMFAHKFKAPIVTIGTLGFSDFMDRDFGLMTPWAFVPHPVLLYTDKMSFFQRVHNTLLSLTDMFYRHLLYLPKQDRLARQYFQMLPQPLPSVQELEKSISVMLINNHISTSPPRPTMPGLVNVGGAHVKPPKRLPPGVQDFLDGAVNGAIYFSLGSYIKSSDMPNDKLKAFLDVFEKLKQRVLWKYEDTSIQSVPKNVMLSKWLPQSDVLAHPNVVLFITHGGMFGTQEGQHRGVPMLFVPFFGDQHRNAMKVRLSGAGLVLNFKDVTKIALSRKLNEMLLNNKYANRAKQIAAQFRDNPVQPMDEAMFWIEYVIRNKGAKHLKSPAVDMPIYQYLLLDVFFFLGICLLLVLFTCFLFGKLVMITLREGAQRYAVEKKEE